MSCGRARSQKLSRRRPEAVWLYAALVLPPRGATCGCPEHWARSDRRPRAANPATVRKRRDGVKLAVDELDVKSGILGWSVLIIGR
jgi:hypothetical protein